MHSEICFEDLDVIALALKNLAQNFARMLKICFEYGATDGSQMYNLSKIGSRWD